MILGPLLTLPAAAMRTTARMLRLLADTGEVLAAVLSAADTGRRAASRAEQPRPARGERAGGRPDAVDPAPAAVTSEDAAAIAAQTAPKVIAALDGLSTAALAELYEHESRNRRRRTVLEAIERATMPPPEVRAPEPLPLDDVRVPDELVYSTQTPAGS